MAPPKPKKKISFRDVSGILQKLRGILLGRSYALHNRFTPFVAPRSIPTPDIPRGPDYKYSNQYYHARSAYHSVRPPVVAPVAQGPPVKRDPFTKWTAGGMNPESVKFDTPPTPGPVWWWDGHFFFDSIGRKAPCKSAASKSTGGHSTGGLKHPCAPKKAKARPCGQRADQMPRVPRSPDCGPRH